MSPLSNKGNSAIKIADGLTDEDEAYMVRNEKRNQSFYKDEDKIRRKLKK